MYFSHSPIITTLFLDLVPLAYMTSGADEVWGMIIFMESALLYNPSIDSFANLKYIATTICHEISHMVRSCGIG